MSNLKTLLITGSCNVMFHIINKLLLDNLYINPFHPILKKNPDASYFEKES